MTAPFRLYAIPGWGSTLVEAQLEALGVEHERILVEDPFASAAARATLAPHNPLTQVPTLILPDGSVMTESAAITLHLADLTGRDDFVPRVGEAERPAFLRWLVFFVANLYPTFTYADDPSRFVADPGAQAGFAEAVLAYRQRLWQQIEAVAGEPWFLGARYSALDIYVTVMTTWRPKRAWFTAHTPRLAAIAERVEARPELAACWARNRLG